MDYKQLYILEVNATEINSNIFMELPISFQTSLDFYFINDPSLLSSPPPPLHKSCFLLFPGQICWAGKASAVREFSML